MCHFLWLSLCVACSIVARTPSLPGCLRRRVLFIDGVIIICGDDNDTAAQHCGEPRHGYITMLGQGQQLCRGYGCPVIHGYYAGWHTCYYIRLAIHRVCQKMTKLGFGQNFIISPPNFTIFGGGILAHRYPHLINVSALSC